MFKSIKATDNELLLSEEIYLSDLEDEELQNHFQISNFRLVTNKRSYGPFGCTDSHVRKPVTIHIDKGDVIAQAVTSFIYPNDDDEPVSYSDSKCFSFFVSFHIGLCGTACALKSFLIFCHGLGMVPSWDT